MVIDRAALNALTSQWAAQKADYDDSENRYRINYNTALDDLKRQRERSGMTLAAQMADRGLTQTGIAAQQNLQQQGDYNLAQQNLAQKQTLNLSTLARKKLEADMAYNTQAPLL